ncbi:hypothetical protein LR48_Vigan06g092900 [Vigna angularis]|uniref:Secreted protein n=1 Tax=Phaseolus angularis TaxID=3914 RepID=A0A0L9US98_PHAAN|nr:hypothetical protein LR48_Vigan06g092900 [Vigna angularis]
MPCCHGPWCLLDAAICWAVLKLDGSCYTWGATCFKFCCCVLQLKDVATAGPNPRAPAGRSTPKLLPVTPLNLRVHPFFCCWAVEFLSSVGRGRGRGCVLLIV